MDRINTDRSICPQKLPISEKRKFLTNHLICWFKTYNTHTNIYMIVYSISNKLSDLH